MRCKPRDLAVIVRSSAGLVGRIVKCVRLHASVSHDLDGCPLDDIGPRWVIEKPLPTTIGPAAPSWLYTVADARLRPIRDPGDDAQDETLTWKNVPQKVEA